MLQISFKDMNTANRNAVIDIPDDLSREVYCVLGIPIDATDMASILRRIETAATSRLPLLISTPNLNFLVNGHADREFRELLLFSDLCPPDGMPIVWIARLLGIRTTRIVAGSDIFKSLRLQHSVQALKVFLFGATEDAASAAARRMNSGGRHRVCWLDLSRICRCGRVEPGALHGSDQFKQSRLPGGCPRRP